MWIKIGTDPYKGTSVYFYERGTYGVNIVVAPARYGKTALVKLLYTKIGLKTKRPIIILDYHSEHKESAYPNWESRDTIGSLPLYRVEDFGFKISDFNTPEDWQSLKFPPKTSMTLANLSQEIDAHKNDPEIFEQMLADAPTDFNFHTFKTKYGIELKRPFNIEVWKAMQEFEKVKEMFVSDHNGLKYINNWQALIWKHRFIHVCLNISWETLKARALVGKILEKLSDVEFLRSARPIFIFEEADKVIPNLPPDEKEMPSSLAWAKEYVLKLQKHKVEMFFIVQDQANLDRTIVSNYHTMIIGGINKYYPQTKYLQWNDRNNYREFMLMNKGQMRSSIFVPEDCPCEMVS
jgi:hypothetical protein